MMRLMLNSKFVDPMLGIVGAHALRMRESYDEDLLTTVLGNLGYLVPDHPDVLALAYAVTGTRPLGIAWPPMLTSSYLDLLRPAERDDPRVLAEASVAERIADYLTGTGPWLSWQAHSEIVAGVPDDVPPAADRKAPRFAVAPSAAAPSHATATTEAAVSRVEAYLADAGRALQRSAREIVDRLGVEELARRTSLPVSSVTAALSALHLVR